VRVVIDAGLVRQTRYHEGRATLALVPIAEDSAAQRAGRGGRTAPGVCYRLWGAAARLTAITLPEMERESLVPLVMTAAAWGERPEDLPLLDAPKPYALEAARADLSALGALDGSGAITEGGRDLFAMPVDAALARLLVEARALGCIDDAIDLVAALSVGRPMFLPGCGDALRVGGCDATALVRAVRSRGARASGGDGVSAVAVQEARRVRDRLRRLHGLTDGPVDGVDRESLARAAMAADSRVVHVARARGREVAFSNGGTELELARDSAVRNVRDVQALVAFETRAFGAGRDARLLITCATPIPLSWIARAGLGRDRLASVRLDAGRVVAAVERVYAQRTIVSREEVPTGPIARAAIAELFQRGSIFKAALPAARERHARLALAARLAARGHPAGVACASSSPCGPFDDWLLARLEELGVQSGEDLALLSPGDLVPPDLPFESRERLDREFPLTVSVGDAVYEADYDLDRAQVLLRMIKGTRATPPPLAYLPRFEGLRVCVDGGRGVTVLRERG
jgi:HrpA-like RNA helicase